LLTKAILIHMNNAEQILVIIVSAVLAIFLIFLIVAVVYIIKVLRQVRRITAQAERATLSVESAAELLGRAASPLGFIKVVSGIVEQVTKANRRKG
jgi:heme/copper-type cytochrome/quinol oxidase subunit 2